ncbi:hypothetical protein SCATT_29880 [Streptantibioticus cattleyicolor NRRL 8057 = DSM 46488]|uniref:Uncharacterized protein n=1 Tax=Streptantibioticus cattleyicolor (strain ATCC 35852 / DSM 46488 / JCM 4925 / NBRC 14057 / NRRL 8057) TaxID=1003195 RepID=G8WSB9_STREN|nr:hypothetical protein SCATT_29880 [Streptantibioticus cattleyicolor NRRL 8057 = DSM 46488]
MGRPVRVRSGRAGCGSGPADVAAWRRLTADPGRPPVGSGCVGFGDAGAGATWAPLYIGAVVVASGHAGPERVGAVAGPSAPARPATAPHRDNGPPTPPAGPRPVGSGGGVAGADPGVPPWRTAEPWGHPGVPATWGGPGRLHSASCATRTGSSDLRWPCWPRWPAWSPRSRRRRGPDHRGRPVRTAIRRRRHRRPRTFRTPPTPRTPPTRATPGRSRISAAPRTRSARRTRARVDRRPAPYRIRGASRTRSARPVRA